MTDRDKEVVRVLVHEALADDLRKLVAEEVEKKLKEIETRIRASSSRLTYHKPTLEVK